MVSTKPVIKASTSLVTSSGYHYGNAPSKGALLLEEKVLLALKGLGGTSPKLLTWSSKGLLAFIEHKVEYSKGSTPQFVLEDTLQRIKTSHPHIKAWGSLSTKEVLDFLLGVDIALNYQGVLIGFDITANPGAVKVKMHKVECAYRGARMDILRALGFYQYVVILADKWKDIKPLVLKKELDKLLKSDRFVGSIDLL